MTNNTENRRAFHRIFFEAPVAITDDSYSHMGMLIDISLNGALVKKDNTWKPQPGDTVILKISLSGHPDTMISMEARVSHIEDNKVGLKREHIDMDSISHLRRLVELNLGDSQMLHRELEHLIEPDIQDQ